jgi:hypothetical protein
MRFSWGLSLLLPLVFLVGCLEVHQQFTINPDRSAKVRVKLAFDLALLKKVEVSAGLDIGNEANEAKETLRSLAQQCLSTAIGVEAWTDYVMQRHKDILQVSMTAYLRDVTKFELNPDNGEIPNMMFRVESTSDGHERWQMHMRGLNDYPETLLPPALAEDEIKEVLDERRLQFEDESAESKVLFDAMKITAVMRLPGKVLKTSNAERVSPQEAVVTFEGKRFYAMMEKVLGDDQLAEKAFGSGAELHSDVALPGSQVNAWLFGEKAPVAIMAMPGDRPLFDYDKELAHAKKNPPPVFEVFE